MNNSTRPVTSIEYGWRIAAPTACAHATMPTKWETATADVAVAPSGGEVTVKAPESLSRIGTANELAAQANATHTPVVLITIGVLTAHFADGSTWSDDDALQRNIFDDGRAEKEEDCHSPTVREMQGKKAVQAGSLQSE